MCLWSKTFMNGYNNVRTNDDVEHISKMGGMRLTCFSINNIFSILSFHLTTMMVNVLTFDMVDINTWVYVYMYPCVYHGYKMDIYTQIHFSHSIHSIHSKINELELYLWISITWIFFILINFSCNNIDTKFMWINFETIDQH